MRPLGPHHVLRADPVLADGLSEADRPQAEAFLRAPAVRLEPGEFTLDDVRQAADVRGAVSGAVVLSGALEIIVGIDDHEAARRIGPPELLLADGLGSLSVPVRWTMRAVGRTDLAVLDDRFLAAVQRWPRLINGVLRRAGQQARDAAIQQAISQLPRVEDRLLALLWTLADHGGQMTPDGARVDAAFTHQDLGRMIGAARPTVSLGLQRLQADGLLQVDGDAWVLVRTGTDRFNGPLRGVRAAAVPAVRAFTAEPHGVLAVGSLPDVPATTAVPDEDAALAVLGEHTPALVVVAADAVPETGGRGLAELLRGTDRLRGTRVIVVHDGVGPIPKPLATIAHDLVHTSVDRDGVSARVQAQVALAGVTRPGSHDG